LPPVQAKGTTTKEVMNLNGKEGRGTCKMALCRETNIAAFQWLDSKIVNCVSSYLDFRMSRIERQIGAQRKSFHCPSALAHYQQHMGGVDKGDQMRTHFGGFAAQSHFKKWYKKTLMAVLDCMLLNGLHMWNMSAKRVEGRKTMERYEFMQAVAHELLHYETKILTSPVKSPAQRSRNRAGSRCGEYTIGDAVNKEKRCSVCCLVHSIYARQARLHKGKPTYTRVVEKVRECSNGTRRKVCSCDECGVHGHNFIVRRDTTMFIHGMFPGMTCLEILHSGIGNEIWKVARVGRRQVTVNYQHEVVRRVRDMISNYLSASE
jgi:hypothetical protein